MCFNTFLKSSKAEQAYLQSEVLADDCLDADTCILLLVYAKQVRYLLAHLFQLQITSLSVLAAGPLHLAHLRTNLASWNTTMAKF